MKKDSSKVPESLPAGVDNGVPSVEQGIMKTSQPSSIIEKAVKSVEDIQGDGTEPIITPSEKPGQTSSENTVQRVDQQPTNKERIYNLLKVYPDGLTDSEIRDKLNLKNNPHSYIRDLEAKEFVIRKSIQKSVVGKKVTKYLINPSRSADETDEKHAHSSSGWKTTLKTIQTLTKLDKNQIHENALNAYLQQTLQANIEQK